MLRSGIFGLMDFLAMDLCRGPFSPIGGRPSDDDPIATAKAECLKTNSIDPWLDLCLAMDEVPVGFLDTQYQRIGKPLMEPMIRDILVPIFLKTHDADLIAGLCRTFRDETNIDVAPRLLYELSSPASPASPAFKSADLSKVAKELIKEGDQRYSMQGQPYLPLLDVLLELLTDENLDGLASRAHFFSTEQVAAICSLVEFSSLGNAEHWYQQLETRGLAEHPIALAAKIAMDPMGFDTAAASVKGHGEIVSHIGRLLRGQRPLISAYSAASAYLTDLVKEKTLEPHEAIKYFAEEIFLRIPKASVDVASFDKFVEFRNNLITGFIHDVVDLSDIVTGSLILPYLVFECSVDPEIAKILPYHGSGHFDSMNESAAAPMLDKLIFTEANLQRIHSGELVLSALQVEVLEAIIETMFNPKRIPMIEANRDDIRSMYRRLSSQLANLESKIITAGLETHNIYGLINGARDRCLRWSQGNAWG